MVELPHVIRAMYLLEESYAVYYMRVQGVEQADILQEMTIAYEEIAYQNRVNQKGTGRQNKDRHHSTAGQNNKQQRETWQTNSRESTSPNGGEWQEEDGWQKD